MLFFEDWKLALRQDCQKQGKMVAFDAMGERALKLWWETGIEPTVNALIDGAGLRVVPYE